MPSVHPSSILPEKMKPNRIRQWLALALCFFTAHVAAEEECPDALILAKLGIEPELEGLRSYLSAVGDTAGRIAKAERLFAQLESDEFVARQTAQRELEAMPRVPEEVLKAAMEGASLEAKILAAKLTREQSDGDLSTELRSFACMRLIAERKIPGLGKEIIAAAEHTEGATRLAAAAALVATFQDGDDVLLRDGLEKEAAKAIVEKVIAWRKDSPGEMMEAPSWGDFIDGKLVYGKGEGGHKNEFVRDIGSALEGCFETTTKSANTMGPVSLRHKTAPWLYPDEDWGEIPKVIEEKGQKLYPLWGTWLQDYSKKTIRLDENGRVLNGKHSVADNIHRSSSIRFLIVPIDED